MPKKIENVREKLMCEAKRQVNELGFAAVTMRSVASGAGVGIGTIYNYYPTKEALITSYILDDWNECIEKMLGVIEKEDDPIAAVRGVYEINREFYNSNQTIISDRTAKRVYGTMIAEQHEYMISSLGSILTPIVKGAVLEDKEFAANILAQTILHFMVERYPFERAEPFYRLILEGYAKKP